MLACRRLQNIRSIRHRAERHVRVKGGPLPFRGQWFVANTGSSCVVLRCPARAVSPCSTFTGAPHGSRVDSVRQVDMGLDGEDPIPFSNRIQSCLCGRASDALAVLYSQEQGLPLRRRGGKLEAFVGKGAKLFSFSAGFMLPALLSYRGRCWPLLSRVVVVVVVVVVEVKEVVQIA
jgi:hypothetical protein